VMFPVQDPELRQRIYEEILLTYLTDTAKSRILNRDGSYTRAYQLPGVNGKRFAAQDFLVQLAEGKAWHAGAGVNGAGAHPIAGAGKPEGSMGTSPRLGPKCGNRLTAKAHGH